MIALLASFLIVFLAEMGDKTQLLAMTLATKFRWQTVLLGIFIATSANHLFAVAVGNYLTHIIPIIYIKIAASIFFILSGLWTLRGDKLSDEESRYNFSPLWSVMIAFFLAEMGDKTQLATIALAAKYSTIVPVWIGSTTGMLVADIIGIVIGIVLGKKLPEELIKWVSAIILITFGAFSLYEVIYR